MKIKSTCVQYIIVKNNLLAFIVLILVLVVGAGAAYLLTHDDDTNTSNNGTNATNNNTNNGSQNENSRGKTYTLSDLAAHSSASDCWLAIDGKVYDVTNYIGKHPGGNEITKGCGKDATQMFKQEGHSRQANLIASEYQIGILAN